MSPDATPPRASRAVRVRAPGRLHLGFLDPSGSLGRCFGSIGLVVDGFETAVELSMADSDAVDSGDADASSTPTDGSPQAAPAAAPARSGVSSGDAERAAAHLSTLRERTGWRQPLRLRLLRTLPSHAGLGSGTQLALAVGRAFACLRAQQSRSPPVVGGSTARPPVPPVDGGEPGAARLPVPPVGGSGRGAAAGDAAITTARLAQWLGRGMRSGVGIAGFDHGGLLVDGGPAADGTPARLLSRLDFPAGWRVVVVLDSRHRGLSGAGERQAIADLPPLPQSAAADICHQLLMRVLPGAAAAEFGPFAAGVTRIQQLLGDHFASAQGGRAFSSSAVAGALGWMAAHAAQPVGSGQSSWGPTGFAIVESQRDAERLVAAARTAGAVDAALEVRIVGGRNHGAAIEWPGTDPA